MHAPFMRHALALAARNLGQTWPNPAVGCVIVRQGDVVGCGYTARTGRPHAESEALAQAGESARGATAYVTLEPCAHIGKTPPCADTLIHAGIKTVVIACRDPDPRVNGKGIARLQDAGIEVIEGIEEEAAKRLNAGFFLRVTQRRPWVTVKIATSLDGKIAWPAQGNFPRWITGQAARDYGHTLRATHDAILTGIGTVLADDPLLTCRLPGLESRSPVRVVLDRKARLPEISALATTARNVPVWLASREKPNAALENAGVTQLALQAESEISHILHMLAEKDITRLLVEGGAEITKAFLHSGLVDRLYWFRAPALIGKDGLDAVGPAPDTARFRLESRRRLGEDMLEVYTPCSPAL